MPLLQEWMTSSRKVSAEWRQAGVMLVFEKVDLTSVSGCATERLVWGLMTGWLEEDGVTSAS